MDFEGAEIPQGGPWGYRHQFNIADSGSGARGPRVWNDRAGEVGRTLNAKDFDLERLFAAEGVQIVHLSGLIGSLSPETGRFCLQLAHAAKKHGTKISFDLNYRATFWKGREKELAAIFAEIAGLADVLVGNEEDFQLCLGVQGPEAGGKGLKAEIAAFKEMIHRVRQAYPSASVYGTTLREVVHTSHHLWARSWPPATTGSWSSRGTSLSWTASAAATGSSVACSTRSSKAGKRKSGSNSAGPAAVLATTLLTDYAQPADEEQVWSILARQRPRAAMSVGVPALAGAVTPSYNSA